MVGSGVLEKETVWSPGWRGGCRHVEEKVQQAFPPGSQGVCFTNQSSWSGAWGLGGLAT